MNWQGLINFYRLEGRETHLSRGDGGEFLKFVFENSGGKTLYYRKWRETIYPVKDYPEFIVPPPPDTDEEDDPEVEPSEKRARPEKAKYQRKKSVKPPVSAPNQAKNRRQKPPMTGRTTDRELIRIQKERLSTLRPRRNGEVYKIK